LRQDESTDDITLSDGKVRENARVAAVVSPDLGVSAEAATRVFCVLFAAWRIRYLSSVSAADPVQIFLSLLF
jgi:hypothetical protein